MECVGVNFLVQNTGVGSHSLLRGILPTEGWNPGPLHCRRVLYQLSLQGSPKLHWRQRRSGPVTFGYRPSRFSCTTLLLLFSVKLIFFITRVQSLGQQDLLEKEMATHSNILAWEIPRTEEPGGLRRVGHDWACMQRTNTSRMHLSNTIPPLYFPFFWELGVKTYFLHLGFNTLGLTLGFSQNRVVLFSSFHICPECGAELLLSSPS